MVRRRSPGRPCDCKPLDGDFAHSIEACVGNGVERTGEQVQNLSAVEHGIG